MGDRLTALDGWRALSVLAVIGCHLQVFSSLAPMLRWAPQIPGGAGVQFFFGISGFVICRGLLAEREREGRVSFAGFYKRRAYRILPPFIVYIAAVVALELADVVGETPRQSLQALTFTCNLPHAVCGWSAGHTWSLAVEEQFYLLAPALIAILPARLLTAAILVFPAGVVGLYAIRSEWAGVLNHFLVIAAGVGCALHVERLQALVRRLPWWTAVVAAAGAIWLYAMQASAPHTVIAAFAVPALVMFALLSSAFVRSPLQAMLNSRPLQALGAISYSVYLWQQLATGPAPGAGWAYYAITVAACLCVAALSYRYVERPMIRAGRKLGAAGSPARPQPAT